ICTTAPPATTSYRDACRMHMPLSRVPEDTDPMASYKVNRAAVAHARRLIDQRRYVLDSDWGEVQPSADDENAFLEHHSWEDYAAWHLGLTDGANDETKARYAFVVGDLKRVHRSALIALRVPRVGMAA